MISIGDQTEWVEKGLERLRYEYDLKPSDYCIDIGSYRMEWATEIIKRYGCKVECFDALDNRAAWTHDGVLMMGGAYYYTSMFDDKGMQEFKCVDIAPYLQKEIAVMKINIEGGEYRLLNYIIDKGDIMNIKNIQVQFHLSDQFNTDIEYMEINRKLHETHELTWRYPFVWENWERI
jgi:hypothetical protein